MSSPRRPTQLRLQALEARETPAAFGEAWLDGQHLTLSFAAEGTPILGAGNSLGSILNGLGAGNAKHEVLRAFQTWAAKTNLNVGVVADQGTPYDEAGAIQGDPRFGDIRVAARPLAADVVALTSPAGPWSSNAGDILLNSNKAFSLGGPAGTYDLFSVFLQEAGHAFGVGTSTDPASVMYQTYSGVRAGLAAADVAAVQSLYGTRRHDRHEGAAGNDTQATATLLTGEVKADVTTTADADWYTFSVPDGVGTWVRLKAAGVSLLAPRVEVYNAAGELLASGQSADPQANDVSVQVGGLGLGGVYYVKVSGARADEFGVGAYKLAVDAQGGLAATDPYALVDAETSSGGLGSAATLSPVPQLVSRPGDYLVRSALASTTDADVFRVKAPASTGQPLHLVVSAAGVGAAGLNPRVEVYTAGGIRLYAATASKSANHLIACVANVTPGADYLVKVTSATGAVANYDLACVFRTVLPASHGADGSFASVGQATTATMYVYQSQVMHLSLGASGGWGSSDTTVRVTIYNSANQVVFQMAVRANQLNCATVFLKRGAYKVEVKAVGTGSMPALGYGLRMYGLTDPEGSSTGDTTGDPSGGTSDPLPPPPEGSTDPVVIEPPPPPPPDSTDTTLAGMTATWF